MDCTHCNSKGCRVQQPCIDRSDEYLADYQNSDIHDITQAASLLVDGGRAGTLNRLEEISEYAKSKGYQNLGVAYCYGMEREALLLKEYLKQEGFRTNMVSCTVDGVTESQIDPSKDSDFVSCNPLGQANVLNQSGAEFTILMGLCLGHDVLIQKSLTMDFTTWLVKDRVTKHRPLYGLPGYHSVEDQFLENLPRDFNLISWQDLQQRVSQITVIDLRSQEAHERDGLAGSQQCLIQDLPSRYRDLLPDKAREVVLYCNGGMQSLYAVMYLTLHGYHQVKSLAGGYANYLEKTKGQPSN